MCVCQAGILPTSNPGKEYLRLKKAKLMKKNTDGMDDMKRMVERERMSRAHNPGQRGSTANSVRKLPASKAYSESILGALELTRLISNVWHLHTL